MKALSIIGILLVSLILGFIIRVFTRKNPKAEVILWICLIAFWTVFLVYSSLLTIKEDTPLFTKHHMANELFVISSIIFLVIGIILLTRSIKRTSASKGEPL